jgi:hypothetical protein
MATEREYDEVVAPMLREVARLCQEHGLSLVARVEWASGDGGITQVTAAGASPAHRLTQLAAHACGNFDALAMSALKHFDCSQSAFLARFNHHGGASEESRR